VRSGWPAQACVKVDDTEPRIADGGSARSRTVGVALSGSAAGLSYSELQALPPAERAHWLDAAVAQLASAGAHYAIDSVADLIAIVDEISMRLTRGEQP
jgi:phosphonoacetaldehyde hydrolase